MSYVKFLTLVSPTNFKIIFFMFRLSIQRRGIPVDTPVPHLLFNCLLCLDCLCLHCLPVIMNIIHFLTRSKHISILKIIVVPFLITERYPSMLLSSDNTSTLLRSTFCLLTNVMSTFHAPSPL